MSQTQLIFNSLRRLVRALRLNSGQVEAKTGLSGAQLFVLQKIKLNEWVSVSEIAERTQTDQSSVSVVIKKLEAQKLLLRKPDAKDQRRSLLSLTEKGQLLSKRKTDLVQDRLMSAIEVLSESDRNQLSQLLQKLTRSAGLDLEPTSLFFENESARKNAKRLSVTKKT